MKIIMLFDISFLHISLLTAVGAVTIIGFYSGSLARLVRLPSLIGYMLLGVLLGPSVFNLLTEPMMVNLSFITSIALGLVAFSIGTELSIASLRRLGPGIISIILAESFGAFLVVGLCIYLLTRNLPLSLIFAAMAPASAPAGTVAVIHEYKAKGSLTKALYAVVGFDDGLAILIFAFAAAIAKYLIIGTAGEQDGNIFAAMAGPAKEIGLSLLVGGIMGFVFSFLVKRLRSSRDIFIVIFGIITITCGLSNRWHLSLIMTNMVIGFVLANTSRTMQVHHISKPLNEFMPLIFVLFFALAGAHLEIGVLPSLGLVGVVYIFARSAGLIGGARLGAMIGNVEEKIKKYIGFGILSQAGVAIGLSLIMKHELDIINVKYNLPGASEIGAAVLTTVTATCIFFEIIGPICTKIVLKKAGEIPDDKGLKPTDDIL